MTDAPKNLHSDNITYERESKKFTKEDWLEIDWFSEKWIMLIDHIAYNKMAQFLMEWKKDREYVNGFLHCMNFFKKIKMDAKEGKLKENERMKGK